VHRVSQPSYSRSRYFNASSLQELFETVQSRDIIVFNQRNRLLLQVVTSLPTLFKLTNPKRFTAAFAMLVISSL
jgi:hypothetical protein